mgnify:CR=1 FL=1
MICKRTSGINKCFGMDLNIFPCKQVLCKKRFDTSCIFVFDKLISLYIIKCQHALFYCRLYQGQTTNFRTPGGGFSPIYLAP